MELLPVAPNPTNGVLYSLYKCKFGQIKRLSALLEDVIHPKMCVLELKIKLHV